MFNWILLMKKIISLMLAVLMVPISYAQEMNGTWKGILNAGNQELEIVFHFNSSFASTQIM